MADAERERRDSRDRYDDDDDADDIKYDILIPQHEIILKQGYAGPSASPVNRMLMCVPRERRYGTILFSNHSVAPYSVARHHRAQPYLACGGNCGVVRVRPFAPAARKRRRYESRQWRNRHLATTDEKGKLARR